jgi:hypothetical protein
LMGHNVKYTPIKYLWFYRVGLYSWREL